MSTDSHERLTPAEVVATVDEWLAQNEGASRVTAFAMLAERTGRTPGSVSQSYYTAKRTRGAGRKRRRPAVTQPAKLSAKPSAAIRSLTEYVEALEREVVELREFKASVLDMVNPTR